MAYVGWKLFEVTKNGMPKTLVHRLVTPYTRGTRVFPLDTKLYKEVGTKGFNVFASFNALEQYLPRFRVRGKRLAACQVEIDNWSLNGAHSIYLLAETLYISKQDWDKRILGADIL